MRIVVEDIIVKLSQREKRVTFSDIIFQTHIFSPCITLTWEYFVPETKHTHARQVRFDFVL